MSTKDIRFEVGGRELYIRQWPAKKSLLMKFRLMKMMNSSLTELTKAFANKDNMDDAQQVEALSKAVGKLFESSSEEAVLDLIIEVVEQATMDGERLSKIGFDNAFEDEHLIECYAVFFKILGGNYSGLLKGLNLDTGVLSKVQLPTT